MATDTGIGRVRFFDDFLGDTLNTNDWVATANGGGTAMSIIEAIPNGVAGSLVDTDNGDINNLLGADIWIPGTQGTIVFEARVKLVTSISQGVYVGFSDDNTETDEMPMSLDAGTFATQCTDGCGFLYDSDEGANWYVCSVKNGSDGTQTNSGVGPVIDTWQTLRMTIEANGDIRYYIDGKEITVAGAARSAAITTTAALSVGIGQLSSGTAAWLKVDYVYVSGGRQ